MPKRDRMGWVVLGALVLGLLITPRLTGARVPGSRLLPNLLGAVAGRLDRTHRAQQADQARAGRETQEARPFRWSGELAAGRSVEIKGVNGPIEAVPATGRELVVEAIRSARRSDPSEVRIEVLEHEDGVTVCALYPSRRGRNACESGDEWRSSVRDNDVRVRFRVEVPSGVELRAQTVNGDVVARNLAGDVWATTVNGDLELSAVGISRASTVNGSIRASLTRWDGGGASFETVNGSIDVDVPDDVDADLDARWVNGGLESELPFQVKGRIGRHSAAGVLGSGGEELRLKTVNGSLRIR